MKPFGKKWLLLSLVLVLALGVAAYTWAQPMGRGESMGPGESWGHGLGHHFRMHGHLNLTPAQAGQLFDVKEKFRADTAKLRRELCVKRAEMAQLWKAENPNEKAIVAKAKELNALKGQMIEKRVAMRLAIRKIVPHGFWGGPCPFGGPGGPMGPGAAPPPAPPAKAAK